MSETRVIGLIAAAVLTTCIGNVWGQSPDVSAHYCPIDSPVQDLTLIAGDFLGFSGGLPLPDAFGNGTKSEVTFTTTMKANRFFGAEHVVSKFTVPPGIDLHVFDQVFGVDFTTPLGTDIVVVEVTTSATGATVIRRCTFNLTVTRRTEQRDVIGIPLRPCFLEGTELSFDLQSRQFFKPGQLAPPGVVLSLIDRLNDQTWLKYARIVFRAAASAGVPVIKDPRPPTKPPADIFDDVLGAVEIPAFLPTSPIGEPGMVKAACELAWQGIDSLQKGIVVVFVRRFLNAIPAGTLGFAPPADSDIVQRKASVSGSTRLCQHPRQLQTGDVTNVGWVLLLEPTAPLPTNNVEMTVNTLAHELGHALLLGHGNGFDDDANGALPPVPGPRRFDEYCDTMGLADGTPLEDARTPFVSCEATESLMRVSGSCSGLRPLQVEQARAAAKLVPGAAFDAAADPAGTLISEQIDPTATGIPADVLIASVEVAETPGQATMEISQKVIGALPETAHNRYTTFVDLDNNSATGCMPADLGLPTAFRGAELVTSVVLEATGGQSPQLTVTVWRCAAGTLVPLPASDIKARASDTELAIHGPSTGRLLGRINVVIPSCQRRW
jgi:hypothetical protein